MHRYLINSSKKYDFSTLTKDNHRLTILLFCPKRERRISRTGYVVKKRAPISGRGSSCRLVSISSLVSSGFWQKLAQIPPVWSWRDGWSTLWVAVTRPLVFLFFPLLLRVCVHCPVRIDLQTQAFLWVQNKL